MREETPLWVRRGLVRGDPFVAMTGAVRGDPPLEMSCEGGTPPVGTRADVRGDPQGSVRGGSVPAWQRGLAGEHRAQWEALWKRYGSTKH